MSKRNKLLRGGSLVSTGQAMSMALTFVRNLILARLLGPENMGVAAILITTLSFLELVSDMSVMKLVVQHRAGNRPSFMRTAQAFELIRGVLMAVLLFALAWPTSMLFDLPDLLWAFQLLALVPLVRAFLNLDYARQQRHLRYLPTQAVEVTPMLVTTALALPLCIMFADWRAALVIILIQPFVAVGVSHLVAEKRYRWRVGWRQRYVQGFLRFGLPLLVNGTVLFWAMQGDRVLMGVFFSPEILGLFYIAMNLSNMPMMVLMRIGGTLLLAPMSHWRDDPVRWTRNANLAMQGYSFLALLVAMPFVTMHGIVSMIYGSDFGGADAFVGWLAIAAGIRLIFACLTMISLSKADPYLSLFGSLTRSLGVAVALLALIMGGDVMTVIYIGVTAEGARLVVGLVRLNRRHQLQLGSGLTAIGMALGWLIAVALIEQQGVLPTYGWPGAVSSVVIWIISAVAMLAIMAPLRRELKKIATQLRKSRD